MLKTYYEYVVEIPENAHANSSGSVYVVTEKKYIKDKGYNIDTKKCIGKYISSTTMHPNSNYKLLYPAKWEELTQKKSLPGKKKVGMTAFISSIEEKYGIKQNLSYIFGVESSNAILDYCMFLLENQYDDTEQFETAMSNHILFSAKLQNGNWYSNFLKKGIDSYNCTKLKNGWAYRSMEKHKDVYICISDCDSEDFDTAKKSRSSINIINNMYAVSEIDCTPISFAEYHGREVDSKAIEEFIDLLRYFTYNIKGVILDKPLCNESVLDYFKEEGIEYIVLLPRAVAANEFMMTKYAEDLKWNVNHYIRETCKFGLTDEVSVFGDNNEKSFIHLFYDNKETGASAVKLISDVNKIYNESLEKAKQGICPVVEGIARRYITISTSNNDGENKYQVTFDQDVLQKDVDYNGFYAIATSEEITTEMADSKFHKIDNYEFCYKLVKSHLGFTNRAISENTVRVKLLICFLLSIFRNEISNAAKKCKISVNDAIREISSLECKMITDDNYVFIHDENSIQLSLLEELGITDKKINSLVTEENNANHGIIEGRRRRKPGPKKGSHNNKYDEEGKIIPRKPGPKPGSHHKTVKLKKDGTPKQKPGPKKGSHNSKSGANSAEK